MDDSIRSSSEWWSALTMVLVSLIAAFRLLLNLLLVIDGVFWFCSSGWSSLFDVVAVSCMFGLLGRGVVISSIVEFLFD